MNPFIRREPIDEAACRAWTADIKAARADYAALIARRIEKSGKSQMGTFTITDRGAA